jgi:hypothetical protein
MHFCVAALCKLGAWAQALDEMERSIRYVLDVNDDLSVLSGGFFR